MLLKQPDKVQTDLVLARYFEANGKHQMSIEPLEVGPDEHLRNLQIFLLAEYESMSASV